MTIFCPDCGFEVSPDDTNFHQNIFLCRKCSGVFYISGAQNQEKINEAGNILENPPRGAWIREDHHNIRIGVSVRPPKIVSRILFCLFFCGMTVGGIAEVIQNLRDAFHITIISVFFLISLFLIGDLLFFLFGKIELVFSRRVYVFSGVGIIGKKRYIQWEQVKDVHLVLDVHSQGPGRKVLVIEEKKKIKVPVKYLSDDKMHFLLAGIVFYKGKKISDIGF